MKVLCPFAGPLPTGYIEIDHPAQTPSSIPVSANSSQRNQSEICGLAICGGQGGAKNNLASSAMASALKYLLLVILDECVDVLSRKGWVCGLFRLYETDGQVQSLRRYVHPFLYVP